MDILTASLPWTEIGWGAIVVLVVLLIIRGYLVPRVTHMEMVEDRDRWRAMAEALQKENTKLLIVGELGVNSIYAIEEVVRAQMDKREAERGNP
jgi:hypothetical protein